MDPALPSADRRLLLTIPEAGRVLGIGRTTTYGLIDAGELEVVRIGGAVRVPVDALHKFVERRMQRARYGRPDFPVASAPIKERGR